MTEHGTTLIEFGDAALRTGETAAVSLHAHTGCSKEGMKDVSRYFERIPIVSRFVRRELDSYARRNNEAVDFTRGWWHPPVDAESVLASEVSQIAHRLGLAAMVSITDHDTIEGGLELQRGSDNAVVPISCEWTVPFCNGFFHLGVHNLPARNAKKMFAQLSSHTQDPRPGELSQLLNALHADPEILIVFNHPLWDLADVGAANHVRLIRAFLLKHGDAIHALEVNGYRAWHENMAVHALQQQYALPLISGGDRHGCAPNALLNLTTARSFGAFAREIRERRESRILVMPEYRTSLVARKLATATEAMKPHPEYVGRECWTDRVGYAQDGVARALSVKWPCGGPLWVRAAIAAFRLAASQPLRPLLRLVVWWAGVSRSHDPGPASYLAAPPATTAARAPQELV